MQAACHNVIQGACSVTNPEGTSLHISKPVMPQMLMRVTIKGQGPRANWQAEIQTCQCLGEYADWLRAPTIQNGLMHNCCCSSQWSSLCEGLIRVPTKTLIPNVPILIHFCQPVLMQLSYFNTYTNPERVKQQQVDIFGNTMKTHMGVVLDPSNKVYLRHAPQMQRQPSTASNLQVS